jgi:hypothetical protein
VSWELLRWLIKSEEQNEREFEVSLSSFGDPFTGLNRLGQGEKDRQGMASERRLGCFAYDDESEQDGAAGSCRSRGKQRT